MGVTEMDKAVILAGGLGTRMQKADSQAVLDGAQTAVADTGMKGLIPIGRPFLDYVLTALADAGYRRVGLVIGPGHDAIRTYYEEKTKPRRVAVEFAVQPKSLGTANAVLAAEEFAAGDSFLVINSDNYYPAEALKALRETDESGLIAFERDALLSGNIPEERIARFAILQVEDGYLSRIIEKPSPEVLAAQARPIYVSMNCWRFDTGIFQACRAIVPSPRGEYEIPDAVEYAVRERGQRFVAIPFSAPVLDLTSREDVPMVAKMMAEMKVDL